MQRYVFGAIAVTVMAGAVVCGQSVTPPDAPSALALLERVAQHYAYAKSYHIESVEENTISNDLAREWRKTILSAAESSGNRYRYEGHTGLQGGALRLSDGKTVWTYHFEEKAYTVKPIAAEEPRSNSYEEYAMGQARTLRRSLANLPRRYKSATQLPDETLRSDGREVSCYVIRVRTADLKTAQPDGARSDEHEKTIWIDKAHETIVKLVDRAHVYVDGLVPVEEESTTTYKLTELDGEVKEGLFAFVPPSEAKLIEDFSDPMKRREGPDMTGKTAPSLKFGAADGKVVSLDSFRGKPVLLNVWATWCAPCVKELPQLAQLRKDAGDRSLVFISVDEDEDAKTAADFLAKRGYDWANFHDADGEVDKGLGLSGIIPRTTLIDVAGKIVFDSRNHTTDEIRGAVARLGPEYATLAPAPEPSPCLAPK